MERVAGLVDSGLYYDAYMKTICGRIIRASGPLRYQLLDGLDMPNNWISNKGLGAPLQSRSII